MRRKRDLERNNINNYSAIYCQHAQWLIKKPHPEELVIPIKRLTLAVQARFYTQKMGNH